MSWCIWFQFEYKAQEAAREGAIANREVCLSRVTSRDIHQVESVLTDYDVIYQAWDAVFYHQMKHWEESWKYDE